MLSIFKAYLLVSMVLKVLVFIGYARYLDIQNP